MAPCNSFTDLIDEMELWDWNVANKDLWSQLAKSLHSQKVSFFCPCDCHFLTDFANLDQKSLFATFQSHSSISSIKSVNELQCHSGSVNVRAN